MRLASLSLVGCKVNFDGLRHLGMPNSPCTATLQDLHLSKRLKFSRYLFKDFHTGLDAAVEALSSHDNAVLQAASLSSAAMDDELSATPVVHTPTDDHMDEDTEEASTLSGLASTMPPPHTDEHTVNLQALLFPASERERQGPWKKRIRCRIYLK